MASGRETGDDQLFGAFPNHFSYEYSSSIKSILVDYNGVKVLLKESKDAQDPILRLQEHPNTQT